MSGLQNALDDLRRERNEYQGRVDMLDGEIANLERSVARLYPSEATTAQAGAEPKVFTNLPLREAAEKIVRGATAPLPTRAICDQLLAGGYKTTAKNFYMVVYAGLKGMPNFVRTKDSRWLWQEGAEPGAVVGEKATKAKAQGHGKGR